MAKKKVEYTLEEQLAVKRSIVKEFNLLEIKTSAGWLDAVDVNPDPKNPEHWDFLLYSSANECYFNLKFFPRISIEPTHTTSYQLGVLYYKKNMPIETILWYIHNILDKED